MHTEKDDTDLGKAERARRFTENVSRLMAAKRAERGETIHQFAVRIGVPYGWLRRISTAGVKQTSKRTLPQLKKLASELGLSSYKMLWEMIPDEVDPDEVIATLKKNHPREWALWVAWQWTIADVSSPSFKSGEEDAEVSVRATMLETPPSPLTAVEDIAEEYASLINENVMVTVKAQEDE